MIEIKDPIISLYVAAEQERRKYNKIESMFKTVDNRLTYSKHMEVIDNTNKFRQVCMMAANRIGKSELGAYIVSCHLTGNYPDWWSEDIHGKTFNKPTSIIAAGETGTLVRDSIQNKLLGAINDIGSGLIPKKDIVSTRPRAGIPNAVDTAMVAHKNGGQSLLQFQSYDQGREKVQATARDVIWCDEEPPLEVYIEMLLRTMTTDGLVLSTFTPLKGISSTIMYMQHQARLGNAKIITATWDDAPHLTTKQKDDLFAALPPHQRDARSKGVPSLGSGAVFPVQEAEFVIAPIDLPKHWRFAYGFDVGWNNTAACWGAIDPDSDVLYVYSDYKRGQAEPPIHAAAIRARGDWIPGAIDPASRGRTQDDGSQLIKLYRAQGLNLIEADNGVESGIFDVYERLCTGRIKVFNTCVILLEEFRLYRRDEKGKIVKDNDHCFTGETRIITSNGLERLDTLTSGTLISLNGSARKFNNCHITKKQADIIEITFSDGYKVKCTPEHKFLTTNGFVKAVDLMDTLSYIVTSLNRGSTWKLSYIQKLSRNIMENITTCVGFISSEVVTKVRRGYTELFGWISIIVKSTKGSTFTTLTKTPQTINPLTFNSYVANNTRLSTTKERLSLSQVKLYWPLLNGIGQKKVKNGIISTIRQRLQSSTKSTSVNVQTVKKNASQGDVMPMPFVQITVNQHIEEQIALIKSAGNVSFVRRFSLLVNILRQKPVQEYAVVQAVKIESAGKQDVYCLDVPEGNLLCLENGVVVHNCMDSLRYLVKTGIKIAKQKIDKKPTLSRNNHSGGWMGG